MRIISSVIIPESWKLCGSPDFSFDVSKDVVVSDNADVTVGLSELLFLLAGLGLGIWYSSSDICSSTIDCGL